MEHAETIGQPFPARRAILLSLAVLLVAFGGRALLQLPGPSSAGSKPAKPLRPRSHVSVLVLNGNGISGAAGAVANRLLAHGYREASATNAQVTTYARSLVLFRGGWAGEAARLAKDTGIRTVAPLDGSLPAGSARYPVVVIVGR